MTSETPRRGRVLVDGATGRSLAYAVPYHERQRRDQVGRALSSIGHGAADYNDGNDERRETAPGGERKRLEVSVARHPRT